MNNEIRGYYCKQQGKLLKDLTRTMELMGNVFQERYGEDFAFSIRKEILTEFEAIIPEIPYFKGYRNNMFNQMLLITSQFLAGYRVLKGHGKSNAEIWVLCDEALRTRLQEIPAWKRYMMKQFWHGVFGKMLKRRGKKGLRERLGNFEMEYIAGDGIDYDFAIHYLQCGHDKFLEEQNAEEFLPYVCLADIALSDAFGWGLARTQTLGDGCKYCDFRFKKGAPTEISSKTPEIQKIIDQRLSSAP